MYDVLRTLDRFGRLNRLGRLEVAPLPKGVTVQLSEGGADEFVGFTLRLLPDDQGQYSHVRSESPLHSDPLDKTLSEKILYTFHILLDFRHWRLIGE